MCSTLPRLRHSSAGEPAQGFAPSIGTVEIERLDELIRQHADAMHESEVGRWQFDYFGRVLIAIADAAAGRMRIITPVAEVGELDGELIVSCLAANFDRALDARYAISSGYLWSAFIHPLDELQESQFESALMQVATLAVTYGTTFNSSGLSFGGVADEGDAQ